MAVIVRSFVRVFAFAFHVHTGFNDGMKASSC